MVWSGVSLVKSQSEYLHHLVITFLGCLYGSCDVPSIARQPAGRQVVLVFMSGMDLLGRGVYPRGCYLS